MPTETTPQQFDATLRHLAADNGDFTAELCRAGRIRMRNEQPGPITVTRESLIDAVDRNLFDGLAMFIDHADFWNNASLRNLAATVIAGSAYFDEKTGAVIAKIKVEKTEAGETIKALFSYYLSRDHPDRPDIGLSISFFPEYENDPESDVAKLVRIRSVESCDFVFKPATYSRVLAQLSALTAQINKLRGETQMPTETPTTREATPPQDSAATAWSAALTATTVSAMLRNADLPQPTTDRLAAENYGTPEQLQTAIDAARAEIAALTAESHIDLGSGEPPRSRHITLGINGFEEFTTAFNALLSGTRPERSARPLSGIREAYMFLSGDYELTGMFHGDRVQFANVTTATMANMTADALNKRVINMFQTYPRFWDPIVIEEDFNSLQDVKWITLGGVGELPTVNEGAAYTELTWDDQQESDAFIKKGGYLGITLEAIDKDDTRRLQAAPRALAQAAWLTLGKSVSAIFTSNSGVGPTMSDGNALFHANHSNVGTTALSTTSFKTTRANMRSQTELNSGEPLGALVAPKYLLVPNELENAALTILLSEGEPGVATNDENFLAEATSREARLAAAKRKVIVIDFWTDANNWAAVADPLLYPSIGIGYRYGRTPEIFSVASPTAGLMFTNDVMPVKVRFFFAVGPTDWRGMYKMNVA